MRTNGVEEVTVVAYHQHRMLKVGEVLFQPSHGLHIQVIGRLVQQQVIRISIESLRQHDTHLFLVVQLTHQQIMLVFLDTQTTQQGGSIAFGIPAVQLGKFLFQFGNLQSILVCEILFGIQHFTLLHDIPQHRVSHHHRVHHRKSIPLKVVLAQNGKTLSRSQHDGARRRVQLPGNRFQESRFSGAVGTDDTITVTTCKLQVYVIEQHSFTKLY